MKTLIAHNLFNLEKLTEELYKLYETRCFTSAMATARRYLFELSFQLAGSDLSFEEYNDFMARLNNIQNELNMMARGRCKGIRASLK